MTNNSPETAKNSVEAVAAWNRETLAIGMAALDGIVLQPIKSTVGPEEDANNWRKYLGRADDLIAYLSRSTQPTLDRTIRDVLAPFAKEAEKWPSDVDDSMKIACCSEITVGNLRAAVPLYGNPVNSSAKNSGKPDRDMFGRLVRETWVRWAETQPSPKSTWLVPYDELSEPDKEADRQIGEAMFRWSKAYLESANVLIPSSHANSRAEAIGAAIQPDMFWDLDGGDDCYRDPSDYADQSGESELVFEMSCAKSLPNKWIAARYVDDEGWKVSYHNTSDEAEAALLQQEGE